MSGSDLQRFVSAQDRVYPQVIRELEAGRKTSHWMWFIFPQLRGLGRSPTAVLYGIEGRAEAQAYMRHDVLGLRLLQCTGLVLAVQGRSAHEIFGAPDDMKLRSCMTLFGAVSGEAPFHSVLAHFYGGEADGATLALLDGA